MTGSVTMALLAVGMGVGALVGWRWTRLGSLLLIALSAVWIAVSVRPEGPLLIRLTEGHGIVTADLVGVVGLCAGSALLVRGPGSRR